MKSLGRVRETWILVPILGIVVASCAAHVGDHNRRVGMAHQGSSTVTEPSTATKVKVQAAYGKLPLHFEANQGQSDEQVHFLSRGNGYTLFLTSTEAVLALRKPQKNSPNPIGDLPSSPQPRKHSLAPVSGSPTSPPPNENPLAPVSGERARVRGLEPEPTNRLPCA
jgi:hypothetical protein